MAANIGRQRIFVFYAGKDGAELALRLDTDLTAATARPALDLPPGPRNHVATAVVLSTSVWNPNPSLRESKDSPSSLGEAGFAKWKAILRFVRPRITASGIATLRSTTSGVSINQSATTVSSQTTRAQRLG
jgi:hypothetical protein